MFGAVTFDALLFTVNHKPSCTPFASESTTVFDITCKENLLSSHGVTYCSIASVKRCPCETVAVATSVCSH